MEQQQRDLQSIKKNDVLSQKHLSAQPWLEGPVDYTEENDEDLLADDPPHSVHMLQAEHGSIAYELLLLQQRLAAYEQLHIEEMAELRQEIERLRRAFLQGTNPHLKAISSLRDQRI